AQGLDLVLLLLLRIDERQVDAVLLRQARLDGLGVRRAPSALGAQLGEADLDHVVTSAAAAAAARGVAVTSARGQRHQRERCERADGHARESLACHVSSLRCRRCGSARGPRRSRSGPMLALTTDRKEASEVTVW